MASDASKGFVGVPEECAAFFDELPPVSSSTHWELPGPERDRPYAEHIRVELHQEFDVYCFPTQYETRVVMFVGEPDEHEMGDSSAAHATMGEALARVKELLLGGWRRYL